MKNYFSGYKFRIPGLLFSLCLISFCSEILAAPLVRTLAAPEGGVAGDLLGCAISTSGDYLIVGAPGDDEQAVDSGAVFIYKCDENGSYILQRKQTITINPPVTGNNGFGVSVAISEEYAIAGSEHFSYVPFFSRGVDNSWQMIDIHRSASDGAEDFGHALVFSENQAIVGAPTNYIVAGVYGYGRIEIFQAEVASWTAVDTPQISSGRRLSDGFGSAVATSGAYLAVGQPHGIVDVSGVPVTSAGKIYLFKRIGDLWMEQVILEPPNPVLGGYFGSSVALSDDYLAVGFAEGVHIYKRNGDTWEVQATVRGSGDIAMTNDYLLSVSQDESNESLYVYKRNGESWNRLAKLPASYENRDYPSVAIAGDAVLLGLPSQDSDTGVVQIYSLQDLEDNYVPEEQEEDEGDEQDNSDGQNDQGDPGSTGKIISTYLLLL